MNGYWSQPRPYIDGERFTGAGKYRRPDLHLNAWYYMPPAAKAAVWWSVAATATALLAGLRVWQAMTATDNEIGD